MDVSHEYTARELAGIKPTIKASKQFYVVKLERPHWQVSHFLDEKTELIPVIACFGFVKSILTCAFYVGNFRDDPLANYQYLSIS